MRFGFSVNPLLEKAIQKVRMLTYHSRYVSESIFEIHIEVVVLIKLSVHGMRPTAEQIEASHDAYGVVHVSLVFAVQIQVPS